MRWWARRLKSTTRYWGAAVAEQPLVSVIIPMRNEAAWLERCLGSVFSQDYPADRTEVIVVDGMSDDGSYETLCELAKNEPRLSVCRNPARIVPSSLNIAINAAKGDIIARVDSHTTLEPDYLSKGVEILERTGADNVGGPMISIGGGAVGDAIAAAMESRFGIGAYFHYATEERESDTVYMGMWQRRVFENVGLFDEELVRNQDDEFNYRLRKAGGRIIVSPAMKSAYQNRQSWQKLRRQFYEYGVWKVRVLQKHPGQMSLRHFVPPAFDFSLLSGLLAGVFWTPPVFAVSAAAVLYLGVMACVSLASQRSIPRGMRMFVALTIIHHAWALGFLVGSVRFATRWFEQREMEPPRLGVN